MASTVATSYRSRKAQHDAGTTVFGKSVAPRGSCCKAKSRENVPDSIRNYSLKLKESLAVKQREKSRYEISLIKAYTPDKLRFKSFLDGVPAHCMDAATKAQLVTSNDDSI
jgi:hypothetical protein